MPRYASFNTIPPSRGCLITPVLRLSHTRRGVEPPNHPHIATRARSRVFRVMPKAGPANAYRPDGSTPTNRHTVDESPVTGSTIRMVLPARSTSIARPALCSTLLVTPSSGTWAAYSLRNRSQPIQGLPARRHPSTYSPCRILNVTPTRANSRCTPAQSGRSYTLSRSPRPGNKSAYTSSSGLSATSSQPTPAVFAAPGVPETLCPAIPGDLAIARPDRPRPSRRRTALALIFLTMSAAPFTTRAPHGERSLTTGGPERQ